MINITFYSFQEGTEIWDGGIEPMRTDKTLVVQLIKAMAKVGYTKYDITI